MLSRFVLISTVSIALFICGYLVGIKMTSNHWDTNGDEDYKWGNAAFRDGYDNGLADNTKWTTELIYSIAYTSAFEEGVLFSCAYQTKFKQNACDVNFIADPPNHDEVGFPLGTRRTVTLFSAGKKEEWAYTNPSLYGQDNPAIIE